MRQLEQVVDFTHCWLELVLLSAATLLIIAYPWFLYAMFGLPGRLPGRLPSEMPRGRLVPTSYGPVRVLTTLDDSIPRQPTPRDESSTSTTTTIGGSLNESTELDEDGGDRHLRPARELVVLVHGYAGTLDVFADSARSDIYGALAATGKFDVLAYDLYGHGFSCSPDTGFSAELFATQLVELLFHFNVRTRVHLVGFSMGASVALLFAHTYPWLVGDVCFIAPSVTMHKLDWRLRIAMRIPYLREIFSSIIIPTFGEGVNRGNPGMLRACFRLLENQLYVGGSWMEPRSGVRESDILASLRDKRVAFLWGALDTVVPLNQEARAVLDAHVSDAHFAIHPSADHMSFADGNEEVRSFFRVRIVNFFLGRGEPGGATSVLYSPYPRAEDPPIIVAKNLVPLLRRSGLNVVDEDSLVP